MEEFNKHITGIRRMMEDMKTEMYAVSNPVTVSLDEYTKNLYMRMLCTIIQYENEPSEMQILYLRRLHRGIGAENPVEDYMRQALDISDVDVREFISSMKENNARFFFALEGILLIAMGKSGHSGYEYLGELIELLGITKKELEHLCAVASSVLEQKSEHYDRAKKIAPESTAVIGFAPYIENYYAGAIVDTRDVKYYSAPSRELSQGIKYPDNYKNLHVTFKNLAITINQQWVFEGCKDVTFVNCRLSAAKGQNLYFRNIPRLCFENCEFTDFDNHVMRIGGCNDIEFTGCVFKNCGYTCYGEKGGVIDMMDVSEVNRFIFCKNSLHSCYIATKQIGFGCGVSGVLMSWRAIRGNGGTEFVIKNNEFIGCQCINNGNYMPAIISGINDGTNGLSHSDNKCTGEVTRLFEQN